MTRVRTSSISSIRYGGLIISLSAGVLVTALAASCGGDDGSKDKKAGASPTDGTGTGTGTSTGTGTDTSKDPKTDDPKVDPEAGPKFWTNTLKAKLEADCSSCHADPRFDVPDRGPLTIFSYLSARKMLETGKGAGQNGFIDKPLANVTHTGGKRCEIDESPCAEIVQWYKLEFGTSGDDSGGGDSDGPVDPRSIAITAIRSSGRVEGWAVKKDGGADDAVSLSLYVGGPKGTGTLAVSTDADKYGDDGNHPGDHHFYANIPAQFADGTERDLYVYDGDTLLTDTPQKFKAWSGNAAGKAYFDANVAPRISSDCTGCHQPSYAVYISVMLTKGPNEGGTKSNNNMINKPGTLNGTTHTGGNKCGGADSGICHNIQEWWDLEFN